MATLRLPHLAFSLVLVDSAALGEEVSLYQRPVSVPVLSEFLVS